jgi:hypothetical protein
MKLFNFNVAFSAIVFCGLLILAGCSSSRPSDLPKLSDVTITITQEGKPLSGAMIALVDAAQTNTTTYSAGGTTDANGACQLYTHGQYKGAPHGKFKVRVSRIETIPKPSPRPKSAAEFEAASKRQREDPPKNYQFVEKIYTDAKTTPLEIEINGSTTKTFDVGKAVKEQIN